MKYELGVSENQFEAKGQGEEGRRSMEGSRIFAYLRIDM